MRKVLEAAKNSICRNSFQIPKNGSFGIQGPEEHFWPSPKCLAIMSGFSGTEISGRVETMKKAEKGRKELN